MKKKVEILGFYKRKRDNSDFVLFKENEQMYLTNGINIWDNQCKRIEKRYIPQCEKVNRIDLKKILMNLKKYKPFCKVLKELEKAIEDGRKV